MVAIHCLWKPDWSPSCRKQIKFQAGSFDLQAHVYHLFLKQVLTKGYHKNHWYITLRQKIVRNIVVRLLKKKLFWHVHWLTCNKSWLVFRKITQQERFSALFIMRSKDEGWSINKMTFFLHKKWSFPLPISSVNVTQL